MYETHIAIRERSQVVAKGGTPCSLLRCISFRRNLSVRRPRVHLSEYDNPTLFDPIDHARLQFLNTKSNFVLFRLGGNEMSLRGLNKTQILRQVSEKRREKRLGQSTTEDTFCPV